MSSEQPTLTGTFGKTPLLHVLVSLLERASTGTLVVETEDSVRSALYLERGVPGKMRLGTSQARLGEVLIDLGYLSRDASASHYTVSVDSNQLFGKTLINLGILSEESLASALRFQLIQKLKVVAALPSSTVFGFYEGVDYLSKWRAGTTLVSPLVTAWCLARAHADSSVVATIIHRIEGHQLRLHAQAQIRSFGFNRTELTLLDVLRARPQTLESLSRMGLVSPHTLERLVYVLTLTRHLDFNLNLGPLGLGAVTEREEQLLERKESLRPSRPVMLGVGPTATDDTIARTSPQKTEPSITIPGVIAQDISPKPGMVNAPIAPEVGQSEVGKAPNPTDQRTPPKVDPILIERRAHLEKLGLDLEKMDHFEVLGVTKDASPALVQETYLKLAKSYHPDRLPLELADLKPLATKVFSRISEAHQVLSEPAKRQAYIDSLKLGNGDSEEEKVRRILRAAGSYQKAEVLLKKRMLAAAELEANRALEDDPDQPDYLALFAWVQSSKPDSESRLPDLLRMLNESITRNPASEKNRYYRVQILKRLGKIDEAVADCRIIVEKNPHHVDALREIRLWEMRRSPQKLAPSAKSTGAKHPSKPPSNPPAGSKRNEPTTGGIFGRFFKR
jgi:curved DNA-binding protein CbpA